MKKGPDCCDNPSVQLSEARGSDTGECHLPQSKRFLGIAVIQIPLLKEAAGGWYIHHDRREEWEGKSGMTVNELELHLSSQTVIPKQHIKLLLGQAIFY